MVAKPNLWTNAYHGGFFNNTNKNVKHKLVSIFKIWC